MFSAAHGPADEHAVRKAKAAKKRAAKAAEAAEMAVADFSDYPDIMEYISARLRVLQLMR